MATPGFHRKQVVSASRRTDIPAFYMEWFMAQLRSGCFHVENPYSRQLRAIPVSPENTDTLVFWSKNFHDFLAGGYGEALEKMGYHLFFNFTVNSEDRILEPHAPSLSAKFYQMGELSRRFGAGAVTWRFDPICHYMIGQNLHDNLSDFSVLAAKAAASGITRCVTSFVDLYRKVLGRERRIPGFSFVPLPLEKKRDIVLSLKGILDSLGMGLYLCCERELFDTLPLGSGVEESACIPNPLLERLSGAVLSRAKDSGQRKAKGCGCYLSKDIGSYRTQPCYHNCLFCYANPCAPEAVHE